MTKPFLVITGMHRSGTSFLTRSLNLAGVHLGPLESLTSHDWKFSQDNERGQWENKKILNLTNQTLTSNNGTWDNLPQKITLSKTLEKEIFNAIEDLKNYDSLASGFKDPRIIPCLDAWEKILPENFILVGIFRHPLKVAESLRIRDSFEYEKSLKLWKAYNEKLLSHLRKHGGFLINFDWPEEKLISELRLIIKKLGLYEKVRLDDFYSKKFLKADKSFKPEYSLSHEIENLYLDLKKLSENNQQVKEIKIKRAQEEYEKIIENFLLERQNLGKGFRIINKENINLIKKAEEKPPHISQLLSLYSKRPDLRDAYPEVVKGDYGRLVNWAIAVIEGDFKDQQVDKESLIDFLQLYYEYEKSIKKSKMELSSKIKQINELKQQHLKEHEVLKNELQRLIDEKVGMINELEMLKKENLRRISEEQEKAYVLRELERDNREFQDKILTLQSELIAIANSIPYQLTKDMTSYIDRKIPPNSKLGNLIRNFVYKKYKKKHPQAPQLIDQEFSSGYHFDDTIDKQSLQNLKESLKIKPKISIIMPVYNPKPDYLIKAIESVKNQYYNNWQLCVCDDGSTIEEIHKILKNESSKDGKISITFSQKNEGISSASNKALKLADGDFTVLLDDDDELAKNALLEVIKTLNENRHADFIYSDEDKLDESGNHVDPFFKPDWSPDLFFAYNYAIHISVFRTSILKEIGGFRSDFDGSQDYDVILRYLEHAKKVIHIPKVLYSWRKSLGSMALDPFEKKYPYEAGMRALKAALDRRKIDAVCESGLELGTYRVNYRINGKPLVSIIIPSKNIENLEDCLQSIFKKSSYRNFEVIVMDSSKEEKIKNFCQKFNHVKCVKVHLEKFNFSKVNNQGVKESRGEYIVFLNDDTKVITPDWIEGLLEHAQREEIGVVGPKLLFRDDQVQHAGTIIGIHRHAGNYGGMHKTDAGYFSLAKIIRNCSAVTAACLMMKKEMFSKIGGFDEELGNSWQDVDLCIRIINFGKLVVYTPYSLLYHFEGGTRGSHDSSDAELEARKIFRKKNSKFLQKGDPYYNPNLSLTSPYRIRMNYSKPLKDLMDLYSRRSDLRQNFPFEWRNSFRNLIDWAATHGILMDSEKDVLRPHIEYYFQICSDASKPLSKKIQLFIKNQKLQKEFPEVYEGKFNRYLKYMKNVA